MIRRLFKQLDFAAGFPPIVEGQAPKKKKLEGNLQATLQLQPTIILDK